LAKGGRVQRNIVAPYACIPFSPDGTLIASGSDKIVHVQDVAGSAIVDRSLEGHIEPVKHISLSPDGQMVNSSSVNGTVCTWNIATALPLDISCDWHPTLVHAIKPVELRQDFVPGSC
jgi:WD40 repeat protein